MCARRSGSGSSRPVEAPVPSDAFATIQVRAFNGARFVLKFGAGATVADLRYKIDAEAASTGPARSARRSRRGATGTTARRSRPRGAVPTAVVVLQKVSASTWQRVLSARRDLFRCGCLPPSPDKPGPRPDAAGPESGVLREIAPATRDDRAGASQAGLAEARLKAP